MASLKTCPHDSGHHLSLSGTRVREMLARNEAPPAEFTRPEVARVLMDSFAAAAAAVVLPVQRPAWSTEAARRARPGRRWTPQLPPS